MKLKTLIFLIVVTSIALAGVFCIQGFQMVNSHCESTGESTLCGNFLSHGTIISSSILSAIFVLVLVLTIVFLSISSVRRNFKYIINKYKYLFLRTKESFLILQSLESSFFKGILHLRKP